MTGIGSIGRTGRRRVRAAAAGIVAAAAVATMTGGGASPSFAATPTAALPAATSNALAAAGCPNPLIIQSTWYPETEHAYDYALIGPNGTVDKSDGAYEGKVGGVNVEVRSGGPFIGNEDVIAALYLHPNIFMTEASTDDAYLESGTHQTVAVMAPEQKSPFAFEWDPAHYHFTSLKQIAASGATVLTEGDNAAIDLAIQNGYVKKSQVDFSWDGSIGRLVESGGKDILFSYPEEDVYNFEHNPAWGKKLDYLLAAGSGYEAYTNALVVTPQTAKAKSTCLKAVVPMIQQAEINFIKNPTPVANAIIKMAAELKSPTPQSLGLTKETNSVFLASGVYGNGTDGTFGSFNLPRVQKFMGSLGSVAKSDRDTPKAGLKAGELVTNQFLDPSIHLAASGA